MRNKIIIISIIIIVLLTLISSFFIYKYFINKGRFSNFVFADVILDIDDLDEIKVENDENSFTFFLENGFWRVKEADGYYASSNVYNDLFSDVYNSIYQAQISSDAKDIFLNPTKISFYNNKKQIEEVLVGRKDNQNVYSFVKIDEETWLATGVFNLPKQLISWISQPRFSIEARDVRLFEREGKQINFSESPLISRNYFSFMFFENVLKAYSFEKPEISRTIKLETKKGLILNMEIFEKNEKYWTIISISTTKLPRTEAQEFVDENSFLYEGWVFQIPREFGKVIFKGI